MQPSGVNSSDLRLGEMGLSGRLLADEMRAFQLGVQTLLHYDRPPSLSKVVGFDGKCSSASCIFSHRERKQVVKPRSTRLYRKQASLTLRCWQRNVGNIGFGMNAQ